MRTRTLLVAMLGAVLAAGDAAAQTSRSTWDGVYTQAQADHGATLYTQNCAYCHGANLAGTFEIAPLIGRFMPYWSGTTLDVMMDYINTAMPLGRLGAVSRADDADIIAYILRTNGLPAGASPLSADANALKAISFDSRTPASGARPSAASGSPIPGTARRINSSGPASEVVLLRRLNGIFTVVRGDIRIRKEGARRSSQQQPETRQQ